MKRLLKFLILILLSTTAELTFGQIINIDKIDTLQYETKAKWDGKLSLGFEIDKQQQTLYDASNYFDESLQKKRELFILSCSERMTSDDNNDLLNTGYAHLRWRHNYKYQLHPEAYVQYQWDAKIGMQGRFVTGSNLRYNFWHKKKWEMTFATGLLYENEKWDYSAVDSTKNFMLPGTFEVSNVKSNNYIKWEGDVSATSKIAVAIFYQAKWNNFFSPRISSNVSFNIGISDKFSWEIKYISMYDSKPVVPIFNFYYSITNSLTYKL